MGAKKRWKLGIPPEGLPFISVQRAGFKQLTLQRASKFQLLDAGLEPRVEDNNAIYGAGRFNRLRQAN
jgi:hypothetical protein